MDNKSDYIDKSLTKYIKSQLNSKKWITVKQKKLLRKYIKNCQTHLSVLSTNKNSLKRIFYIMELLLNSLLFQVYTVEIFSVNKDSKLVGIDNKVLKNTSESKLEFLQELKNFRNRKSLPLKRLYIIKKNGEKRLISISSITDRLVQQLFVLVLKPCIEANSNAYSYEFRKDGSPIIIIEEIQKNLKSKICKGSRSLEPIFIWNVSIKKCFDSINHNWLLKNLLFPPKYIYILKNWLKLGYIEFETSIEAINGIETVQKNSINGLLMNFTLNGMENLIHKEIIKFQKANFKYRLKDSLKKKVALHLFYNLSNGNFKKRKITCRFFRYANNFIIMSSSSRLVFLIKNTIKEFLEQRGLEINLNKSSPFLFKLNQSFDFLGYTFIYLTRTKFIKSKLLHRSKLEYKLHGVPRLFVHPSKSAIKVFKSRLKKLIKKNQNISAYRLIALLNPIIKKWVSYYSFFNAYGVLSLLRKWIYERLIIWTKRKHPKSSRTWLNKHYFLMDNLSEEHNLKNNFKIIEYISKVTSVKQVQQNKWNFYGIARKSAEGYSYEIPKINVIFCPISIKKTKIATVFVQKKRSFNMQLAFKSK